MLSILPSNRKGFCGSEPDSLFILSSSSSSRYFLSKTPILIFVEIIYQGHESAYLAKVDILYNIFQEAIFRAKRIFLVLKMDGSSFSVSIISPFAREFSRHGYNYVSLPNNSEYEIRLRNNYSERCDVEVKIDGAPVGSWMIRPYSSITIEHGEHNDRKFVFVGENTYRADRADAIPGAQANGLITALFKPQKHHERHCASCGISLATPSSRKEIIPLLPTSSFQASPGNMSSAKSLTSPSSSLPSSRYGSGITVSGDHSWQDFGQTSALSYFQIDWERSQEISLRLVTRENDRVYSPYNNSGYPPRISENHNYPRVD